MEDSLGARSGSGRGRTVADYLRVEEMEERGEEELATFECMTPGEMVAGWVRKLRRRKKGGGRRHAKCLTKCACEKTSASLGLVEEDATPKHSAVGGQQEGITSFNLGAGLGLAFVVAASNHELDKMMELRKQMEMIVDNANVELGGKAAACDNSQPCENQTCSNSTTNVEESMNSNGRVSDLSFSESPYIEIDDKVWSDGRCDEGRCVLEGMALEAELQLLELQLEDSEDSLTNNQESSDGGCESSSYDEEMKHGYEPTDAMAEAHYGAVPPLELERRLHELLQSQQQERIKELEAALRRAKQKLKRKEVEARWWRDTAHLISQQISKIAPGYIPSLKDQTHSKFG